MTSKDILSSLNPEQQAVVKHLNGPCIVTAGPGSGKTRTVIERTKYMIFNGINPSEICLFTFTNKAANEIKERVVSSIGEVGQQITVGTYHSICNRLLRQYANYIDFKKTFSILSDDDTDKIIKKLALKYNIDKIYIKNSISSNKSRVIFPEKAILNAKNETEKTLAIIYQEYQEELYRQMAMDFDDLLLNTVILMEKNPDVKKKINNRWKYIVADEGHDSSKLDLRIIKLLAGESENLCFILDDNQSIYGFRGADLDAVMNFQNQLTDLKKYNISKNYRCTQTIVEASKSLINKNKTQIKKVIESARDDIGSKIISTKCTTQEDEAIKTINYIRLLHDKKKLKYKDIAVLYRMSYLSRTVELYLMANKIPYKIIGGTPFFNRMEIQDILSYVKLTVNEYDVSAFKRSVAIPKRGIGTKTIDKIDEYSREHIGGSIPIRQAISDIELKGAKVKESLDIYNKILLDLDKKKIELNPRDFIEYVIKQIEYSKYLFETCKDDEEYEDRMNNVQQLLEVADEYNDIEDLLVDASLYKDNIDEDDDRVQLMTMHASKGLEFKAVILIDMIESIAPHYKSIGDTKQLEEERRLVYVGMTRAKDYLFLLFPQKIKSNGDFIRAISSRFLNEINQKYLYKN